MNAEEQLRWLMDRAQIVELTARYNQAYDTDNPAHFAATFTPDGVMEVVGGPSFHGEDALFELCRSQTPGIVHVTVDPVITIDHNSATQEVTLLVLRRPAEGSKASTLDRTGHYSDHLIRTDGGWLFARRRVTLDGGL